VSKQKEYKKEKERKNQRKNKEKKQEKITVDVMLMLYRFAQLTSTSSLHHEFIFYRFLDIFLLFALFLPVRAFLSKSGVLIPP